MDLTPGACPAPQVEHSAGVLQTDHLAQYAAMLAAGRDALDRELLIRLIDASNSNAEFHAAVMTASHLSVVGYPGVSDALGGLRRRTEHERSVA